MDLRSCWGRLLSITIIATRCYTLTYLDRLDIDDHTFPFHSICPHSIVPLFVWLLPHHHVLRSHCVRYRPRSCFPCSLPSCVRLVVLVQQRLTDFYIPVLPLRLEYTLEDDLGWRGALPGLVLA